MDMLLDPNIWIAFFMLTALEIVLGVDNIVFISILVGRLPPEQRTKATRLGLGFAMLTRLALLAKSLTQEKESWPLCSTQRILLTLPFFSFSMEHLIYIFNYFKSND